MKLHHVSPLSVKFNCVRGCSRYEICVGCPVHDWVSCALNKGLSSCELGVHLSNVR